MGNMAFERMALDQVKYDVAIEHGEKIEPWFQHGTLWCDFINKSIAETIKQSLSNFTNSEVTVSCLKATTTEPWDQWAFDIH